MKYKIPIVEGATDDTGFMGFDYCDEMCGHCMGETFNIPIDRKSHCAHCGADLFPCSACEDRCDWNTEKRCCHRFKNRSKQKIKKGITKC